MARSFVIAGFDSSGMSTDTLEVYDPETDTWTSAASLPIATNHNAAAVAAGKLYARWHQKGFRLFWRWKSKRTGRPCLPATFGS